MTAAKDVKEEEGMQRSVKECRTALANLLFICVPAAAAVILILLIIVTPPLRVPKPSSPSPSCAAETVLELLIYANMTLDPCADFDRFMCSKIKFRDDNDVIWQKYQDNVVYPTLQRIHDDKASKAAHSLHRSCLRNLLDPSTSPKTIWSQVVDTLVSFTTSSQLDALELVGVLDIRYALGILLYVSVSTLADGNRSVHLSPAQHSTWPVFSDSVQIHKNLYRRFLEFTSLSLNLTARAAGITSLIRKISVNIFRRKGRTLRGPVSLLKHFLPIRSFEVWKASLLAAWASQEPVHILIISSSELFAAQLETFADRDQQDEVLAYILLVTSTKLFAHMLLVSSRRDLQLRLAACTEWVENLFHIWDAVAVARLGSQVKDEMLASLVKTTVEATKDEITNIFGKSNEGSQLRAFLSTLKFFDSRKLTSLYIAYLPKFAHDDFAKNVFAVREFQAKTKALDSALNLQRSFFSNTGGLSTMLAILGEHILFSPMVYSVLNLECGPTAWFLNAPIIAVRLADELVWTMHTGLPDILNASAADKTLSCFYKHGYFLENLYYPHLALRIAARAFPFDDWNSHVAQHGVWKVTHSQLFFMLFYLSEVCTSSSESVAPGRPGTPSFQSGLPEFSRAFGCRSSLPVSTVMRCD
ncbi:hypothetical protein V5799_019606 [Amblyomma americanum]|uniref:Uncharacterized protein n=1 Tax=Amblyomma americanum TaxID=6943 RepID=A0AAQ4EWW1_AMBAM